MAKISNLIKNSLYLLTFVIPQAVLAAGNFGLDETANNAGLKISGSLAERSGQIVGSLLSLVGVIFLILIIYAGVTMMTAGGNDTKVKTAQGIIRNATIGLIVVLSAYVITAFLGGSLGK